MGEQDQSPPLPFEGHYPMPQQRRFEDDKLTWSISEPQHRPI